MQKLPTPGKLEKNLIDSVAQQGTTDIYNGLVDKAGAIHKRPGLAFNQEIDEDGGVQAMYYWPSKNLHVLVAGGLVYATSSLASAYASVSDEDVTLAAGPAKIVDTGSWLYIASTSGKMVQWNGTGLATYVADAVAPTDVSAITLINQRVVANKRGTNQIWFTKPRSLTNPTAVLEWDSYVTYGRDSEDIIGLDISGGELVAFKRDSMQAFFDDAVTPLKPIIGSNKFYGLIASSAICRLENALFFVSPDRTIRMLQDREVRDISTPEMGRELQKLKAFENVVAYPLDLKIVFSVPGEGVCYVFDPILRNWSQFTSTDNAGEETGFVGRCTAQVPAAGETDLWLVGGSDSKVYFWDYGSYNDNGNPINFLIRTPQQSWQTSNRKQSTRLVTRISTESLRGPDSPLERVSVAPATAYSDEAYAGEIIPGGSYRIVSVTGLPPYLTAEAGAEPEDNWTLTGTPVELGAVTFTVAVVDNKGANYSVPVTLTVSDEEITMVLGTAAMYLVFRDRYGKPIFDTPETITDALLEFGTYDESYEFTPMDDSVELKAASEIEGSPLLAIRADAESFDPFEAFPAVVLPNIMRFSYTYKGWKYSTTINAWNTLTIKQVPTTLTLSNDSTGETGRVVGVANEGDIMGGGSDPKFFAEIEAAYPELDPSAVTASSIFLNFPYQTLSTIDDLQALYASYIFFTEAGDVSAVPADLYWQIPFTINRANLNLRTGRFSLTASGSQVDGGETLQWDFNSTLKFKNQMAPLDFTDPTANPENIIYRGRMNGKVLELLGSEVSIDASGNARAGLGLDMGEAGVNLSIWLPKAFVPTRSKP